MHTVDHLDVFSEQLGILKLFLVEVQGVVLLHGRPLLMLSVDGARDRKLGPILDLKQPREQTIVRLFFFAPLVRQLKPSGALNL